MKSLLPCTIYFTLSIIILSSCNLSQSTVRNGYGPNMPREPGKCYAKAMMSDVKSVREEFYPVYSGSDINNEYVKTIDIEMTEATTRWEKKRADRNCNAPNPDDCLVWCLVKVPAEIRTINMVTDTAMVKTYTWESIPITTIEQQGGHSEWIEVLCAGELTGLVVANVGTKLKEAGYYDGAVGSEVHSELKAALTKYQKDQGLPVGQFDVQTMNRLGVNY